MELHPSSPPVSKIEKYLGFPRGSFDHIPHYAREQALHAIKNVRDMERKRVFRPGLYYIVLSDLSRSTETSAALGHELNRRRIETFILTSIEALGCFDPRNYFLPVREVGDAVLILFSSFADVHDWWRTANQLLGGRNWMWGKQLKKNVFSKFRMEAKTIVHSGEVAYSDGSIPVARAVNEVFKVEKLFRAGELGVTDSALMSIRPILIDLDLKPRWRSTAKLPGTKEETNVYLIDRA
jgi:class 3 adenylate cyclase